MSKSNPDELALAKLELTLGIGGCVEWDLRASDRLKAELARHKLTLEAVQRALIQHVRNGGKIIQHEEVREGWKDRRDFWYHVIVPLAGFPKGLFVELELRDSDPELPEVNLVNVHEEL